MPRDKVTLDPALAPTAWRADKAVPPVVPAHGPATSGAPKQAAQVALVRQEVAQAPAADQARTQLVRDTMVAAPLVCHRSCADQSTGLPRMSEPLNPGKKGDFA